MKGTVVATWIRTSRKLFGDEIVNQSLREHKLEIDRIFSPLENVPDQIASGLIDRIGELTGKTHEDIWSIIGQENVVTFSDNYPGFFRHESAYQFLKSMNDVHVIVMKRINGATPPILDVKPISSHQIQFTYRSKRGFVDYLRGLLIGVSKFFDEKMEIELIKKEPEKAEFIITFEQEIQSVKKYRINKVLSLGFIKQTTIKAALVTTVFIGLLSFLLLHNPLYATIVTVATFIISSFSNMLLKRPESLIKEEIEKLTTGDFVEAKVLYSKDEYEEIMENINLLKRSVQKDFINFNAIVDEMVTFNTSVSGIAKTMQMTSDDIIGVLDQVAIAAISQAEDTEQVVTVLNESITNLNNVSGESEDNKVKIEDAVSGIEGSFYKVSESANEINDVLYQFSEIKTQSNHMKTKAEDITQIVSIVAGIAKQTNLLALNASIEAARAGEAGKGFSVVAEEVRSLSVETNLAVEKINESLTSFVTSIGVVVKGIDKQYEVLDTENGNLKNAVEISAQSNERLKSVSDLMIKTSKDLKHEADQLSSIFDNTQNLAASAEENSAATQEANANVAMYIEHIHELTKQIDVFDTMITNFQEDLGKYHI
jgi:methyl-accepting chemotaxis protein